MDIRQRFRTWQLEPWPLPSWAEAAPRHRAVLVMQVIVLAATLPLLLAVAVDGSLRPPDLAFTAIAMTIAAVLGTFVFKGDEHQTFDFINAIPMALVMAGRPVDAVLCIAAANVTTPLRKPLPGYLALANLTIACWGTAAAAALFAVLAGGADPASLRWSLAGAATFLAFYVFDLVHFGFALVAARMATMEETLADWRGLVRVQGLTVVPITVMAGAILADGARWHLVVLLPAFLITFQLFDRTDELVEVRSEANRDPLTGLYNRRTLMRTVERAIENLDGRADDGNGHWVILCDLDNFKRCNDTLGHDKGDEALVAAAEVLQESVRVGQGDYCARYGGEEFVVLLRDIDEADVKRVAERLRAGIERRLLPEYGTSVSAGAYRVAAGDSPLAAMNCADQAMYHSKRTGKNRVSVFEAGGQCTVWTRMTADGSTSPVRLADAA